MPENEPIVSSFPPLVGDSPQVLILGSMPGVASLQAQQYYAHPRNAFWRIMADLLGFGSDLPYEVRCRHICDARIAVWDVLGQCQRAGSLDSAIQRHTEVANDLVGFLGEWPTVRRIDFNGAKAEAAFNRHVLPLLTAEQIENLMLARLPSTSPAHAGMTFKEKLDAWRVILQVES